MSPLPVVVRHHEKLELNRVEYSGAITLPEIEAMAAFNAANPAWLTYDCLSLVIPGAEFQLEIAALDAVSARYSELFRPLTFLILRRSAWLCLSPGAEPYVAHWVGARDLKADMSSDVRAFTRFEDAGEWLVLSPAGVAAMRSGEGFTEIAGFAIPSTALTR